MYRSDGPGGDSGVPGGGSGGPGGGSGVGGDAYQVYTTAHRREVCESL